MSVVFEAPRFGPFLLNILELTKGTVHLCCVSSTFCLSLPNSDVEIFILVRKRATRPSRASPSMVCLDSL